MPITINGSGSITGISAGGLPDDSIIAADIAAGAVTTAKVADANITAAKLSGAQSGSAPIYAARAWVNFNGTGIVAINGSGNVSSITDNGTGDYTVNFTTAMSDANYSWSYSCQYLNSGSWTRENIFPMMADGANQVQAGSLRFNTATTNTLYDSAIITVAIFR